MPVRHNDFTLKRQTAKILDAELSKRKELFVSIDLLFGGVSKYTCDVFRGLRKGELGENRLKFREIRRLRIRYDTIDRNSTSLLNKSKVRRYFIDYERQIDVEKMSSI